VLLVLGLIALILFGTPWGLVALVVALCLEILEYFFWKRFLTRYRLRSGPETFVGQSATVIDECDPVGKVRFQGETWNARAADPPIAEGESVRITAVDGLKLDVERDR
jgi:membrane protein implicated in regulation of membrane protease activity